MKTLQWSEEEQCFILANGTRSRLVYGDFCVRHDDARPVLLGDIRVGLLDALRNDRDEAIFVVKDDHSTMPPSRHLIQLYYLDDYPSEDDLRVEVEIPYTDDRHLQQITATLESVTRDIKCSLHPGADGSVIGIQAPDDWHVRDIAGFIDAFQYLLLRPPTGLNTPTAAYVIVITGHVGLLKGHAEIGFDAKISYDLGTPQKNRRLAIDVAAFANSASGGLIVVGLRTKRNSDGEDVIDDSACGLDLINVNQYRDIINDYVFPKLLTLETKTVECHERQGKRLLAILVPPQTDGSKPFIVRHSNKPHDNAIIIPHRTGDRNSYMSLEEIHSKLAGRVADESKLFIDRYSPPSGSERPHGEAVIISYRIGDRNSYMSLEEIHSKLS
jgi:hypothetical protein